MTTRITRREILRLGAGAAGAAFAAPLLGACTLDTGDDEETGGNGEALVFLSTQLEPVEEAEKMRREILAGYEGDVEFIGELSGPFIDRVTAEAEGGEGSIGVLGALHGEFSTLADQDLLADVGDLVDSLSDRNFNQEYLDLAVLGMEGAAYVPWMQASYIMAARQEALDLLPVSDPAELTYDGLLDWIDAIASQEGSSRFGLPGGPEGLLKRFFQGYSYPSFTGGVNTTFANSDAVSMWEWIKEAWSLANPQSVNYAFMQEPLLSGEVWVAWDHTARLIEALRSDPQGFTAFPVPSGPHGRGFMPVVAGLGIPANAPDPSASEDLITYLTEPSTAEITLQQVAFFPPFDIGQLEGLEEAIQAEAQAIEAQVAASDALPSLLPVGLGAQGETYDEIFVESFERIVLDGDDVRAVLDEQAAKLQEIFDQTNAPCWAPDPASEGGCQVG